MRSSLGRIAILTALSTLGINGDLLRFIPNGEEFRLQETTGFYLVSTSPSNAHIRVEYTHEPSSLGSRAQWKRVVPSRPKDKETPYLEALSYWVTSDSFLRWARNNHRDTKATLTGIDLEKEELEHIAPGGDITFIDTKVLVNRKKLASGRAGHWAPFLYEGQEGTSQATPEVLLETIYPGWQDSESQWATEGGSVFLCTDENNESSVRIASSLKVAAPGDPECRQGRIVSIGTSGHDPIEFYRDYSDEEQRVESLVDDLTAPTGNDQPPPLKLLVPDLPRSLQPDPRTYKKGLRGVDANYVIYGVAEPLLTPDWEAPPQRATRVDPWGFRLRSNPQRPRNPASNVQRNPAEKLKIRQMFLQRMEAKYMREGATPEKWRDLQQARSDHALAMREYYQNPGASPGAREWDGNLKVPSEQPSLQPVPFSEDLLSNPPVEIEGQVSPRVEIQDRSAEDTQPVRILQNPPIDPPRAGQGIGGQNSPDKSYGQSKSQGKSQLQADPRRNDKPGSKRTIYLARGGAKDNIERQHQQGQNQVRNNPIKGQASTKGQGRGQTSSSKGRAGTKDQGKGRTSQRKYGKIDHMIEYVPKGDHIQGAQPLPGADSVLEQPRLEDPESEALTLKSEEEVEPESEPTEPKAEATFTLLNKALDMFRSGKSRSAPQEAEKPRGGEPAAESPLELEVAGPEASANTMTPQDTNADSDLLKQAREQQFEALNLAVPDQDFSRQEDVQRYLREGLRLPVFAERDDFVVPTERESPTAGVTQPEEPRSQLQNVGGDSTAADIPSYLMDSVTGEAEEAYFGEMWNDLLWFRGTVSFASDDIPQLRRLADGLERYLTIQLEGHDGDVRPELQRLIDENQNVHNILDSLKHAPALVEETPRHRVEEHKEEQHPGRRTPPPGKLENAPYGNWREGLEWFTSVERFKANDETRLRNLATQIQDEIGILSERVDQKGNIGELVRWNDVVNDALKYLATETSRIDVQPPSQVDMIRIEDENEDAQVEEDLKWFNGRDHFRKSGLPRLRKVKERLEKYVATNRGAPSLYARTLKAVETMMGLIEEGKFGENIAKPKELKEAPIEDVLQDVIEERELEPLVEAPETQPISQQERLVPVPEAELSIVGQPVAVNQLNSVDKQTKDAEDKTEENAATSADEAIDNVPTEPLERLYFEIEPIEEYSFSEDEGKAKLERQEFQKQFNKDAKAFMKKMKDKGKEGFNPEDVAHLRGLRNRLHIIMRGISAKNRRTDSLLSYNNLSGEIKEVIDELDVPEAPEHREPEVEAPRVLPTRDTFKTEVRNFITAIHADSLSSEQLMARKAILQSDLDAILKDIRDTKQNKPIREALEKEMEKAQKAFGEVMYSKELRESTEMAYSLLEGYGSYEASELQTRAAEVRNVVEKAKERAKSLMPSSWKSDLDHLQQLSGRVAFIEDFAAWRNDFERYNSLPEESADAEKLRKSLLSRFDGILARVPSGDVHSAARHTLHPAKQVLDEAMKKEADLKKQAADKERLEKAKKSERLAEQERLEKAAKAESQKREKTEKPDSIAKGQMSKQMKDASDAPAAAGSKLEKATQSLSKPNGMRKQAEESWEKERKLATKQKKPESDQRYKSELGLLEQVAKLMHFLISRIYFVTTASATEQSLADHAIAYNTLLEEAIRGLDDARCPLRPEMASFLQKNGARIEDLLQAALRTRLSEDELKAFEDFNKELGEALTAQVASVFASRPQGNKDEKAQQQEQGTETVGKTGNAGEQRSSEATGVNPPPLTREQIFVLFEKIDGALEQVGTYMKDQTGRDGKVTEVSRRGEEVLASLRREGNRRKQWRDAPDWLVAERSRVALPRLTTFLAITHTFLKNLSEGQYTSEGIAMPSQEIKSSVLGLLRELLSIMETEEYDASYRRHISALMQRELERLLGIGAIFESLAGIAATLGTNSAISFYKKEAAQLKQMIQNVRAETTLANLARGRLSETVGLSDIAISHNYCGGAEQVIREQFQALDKLKPTKNKVKKTIEEIKLKYKEVQARVLELEERERNAEAIANMQPAAAERYEEQKQTTPRMSLGVSAFPTFSRQLRMLVELEQKMVGDVLGFLESETQKKEITQRLEKGRREIEAMDANVGPPTSEMMDDLEERLPATVTIIGELLELVSKHRGEQVSQARVDELKKIFYKSENTPGTPVAGAEKSGSPKKAVPAAQDAQVSELHKRLKRVIMVGTLHRMLLGAIKGDLEPTDKEDAEAVLVRMETQVKHFSELKTLPADKIPYQGGALEHLLATMEDDMLRDVVRGETLGSNAAAFQSLRRKLEANDPDVMPNGKKRLEAARRKWKAGGADENPQADISQLSLGSSSLDNPIGPEEKKPAEKKPTEKGLELTPGSPPAQILAKILRVSALHHEALELELRAIEKGEPQKIQSRKESNENRKQHIGSLKKYTDAFRQGGEKELHKAFDSEVAALRNTLVSIGGIDPTGSPEIEPELQKLQDKALKEMTGAVPMNPHDTTMTLINHIIKVLDYRILLTAETRDRVKKHDPEQYKLRSDRLRKLYSYRRAFHMLRALPRSQIVMSYSDEDLADKTRAAEEALLYALIVSNIEDPNSEVAFEVEKWLDSKPEAMQLTPDEIRAGKEKWSNSADWDDDLDDVVALTGARAERSTVARPLSRVETRERQRKRRMWSRWERKLKQIREQEEKRKLKENSKLDSKNPSK